MIARAQSLASVAPMCQRQRIASAVQQLQRGDYAAASLTLQTAAATYYPHVPSWQKFARELAQDCARLI